MAEINLIWGGGGTSIGICESIFICAVGSSFSDSSLDCCLILLNTEFFFVGSILLRLIKPDLPWRVNDTDLLKLPME